MRIAFLADSCAPFHGKTIEERPLGGTETGVIRLADALHKRGHSVRVFTPFAAPPLTEPLYLPFQALPHLGPVDVLVAVRRWLPLFAQVDAARRFFWTGDSHDQMAVQGIGDRRIVTKLDGLLTVSDWHTESLCARSGFPSEKTWAIRNGIHLPYFEGGEPRVRKRLIYSSTPYRGLRFLPAIFAAVRAEHPDAELHVFSGYAVYQGAGAPDKRAVLELEQLSTTLAQQPGCVLHGNVIQQKLAREYLRSAVLAYPNCFEETSCITAMEAQAAGCPAVTSKLGALPETIGDAGVLIDGDPGSAEYLTQFVKAVNLLLKDDELFQQLSTKGRERAKQFGWDSVAARFEQYLTDHHGLK